MEKINQLIDLMENKLSAIENFFKTDSSILNGIYLFILVVAATYIIWLITNFVFSSILKRSKRYEFIRIDETFYKTIKKICGYTLIMIAGSILINIYNIEFIGKVFYATLIILVTKPIIDLVYFFLELLEKRVAQKTETLVDDIVFDLLKKFSGVIIYILAIISSLGILGVNVMPFVAGAGVAGVAIGFAAKDTLSNLIAGVLLIVDRPFEIGDRIEVWSAPEGSATWGDVTDIGLRATKIKTTDNIIIIIPNNEIMTRDIVNYTLSSSAIRVRINIGVSYDTNIEKAKEVIIQIAKSTEWASKTPEPVVVVKNFGDSSIDLQLRCS